MSVESLVMMFVILSIVWGGLILMMVIAIRRERAKRRDEVDAGN